MNKQVILNKLAHLLNIDKDELSFLDQLEEKELERLRLSIINKIETDQGDIWEKLARVSKFVPAFITGKIAQLVMGPQVCANVSQHMDIKEALKVLKHLSISFLAEVSEYLIPHKSADLINAIPQKMVRKVMNQLLQNEKFYTVASFVDVLDLSKVVELSNDIKSDDDLLVIASFVENKDCLASIVQNLKDQRISKLIKRAFETERADEIVDILKSMNDSQLRRIIKLVDEFSESERNKIIDYFEKQNLSF